MSYVLEPERMAAPGDQASRLPLPLLLNATAGLAPGSAPLEVHGGGSNKTSLVVLFGVLLSIMSMAVACLLVWLVRRKGPAAAAAAAAAPQPADGDEARCGVEEQGGEHPHLLALPVIIVLPDNKSLFGWQLDSSACDGPPACSPSCSSSGCSLCGLAGDGKAAPTPLQQQEQQEQPPPQPQQQAQRPFAPPRRPPPLISVVVMGPVHLPAQQGSRVAMQQQLAPPAQPAPVGGAPPLPAAELSLEAPPQQAPGGAAAQQADAPPPQPAGQ